MTSVKYLKNKQNLESVSKKIFSEVFPPNDKVLIKIHFGEPGNKTALTPDDLLPVTNALQLLNLHPVFIDTPVCYSSPRNTVEGYTKSLKTRGWSDRYTCLISDNFVEVPTKDFMAKVCRELTETKNLLVVSHVKGHSCSGFGGAIKNFGMGGVMKESKTTIHDLSKPILNTNSCTGCGTCVRVCPAGAIKMLDNRPQIDLSTCYGCSVCEVNCPTKSLTPNTALFDDLLAQGAGACINNLPKNSFYINFIQNITRECDCAEDPGEIIAPDLGILFSDNPIAIDQASLDLIGKQVFENIHHKDPTLHLQYAQKYTKFTSDYQLENL